MKTIHRAEIPKKKGENITLNEIRRRFAASARISSQGVTPVGLGVSFVTPRLDGTLTQRGILEDEAKRTWTRSSSKVAESHEGCIPGPPF